MTPTFPPFIWPGSLPGTPFIECYAIQAFSIAFNLDSKLMPKEQNQITMRKVCTVIQSFLLRLPNHHSKHNYNREKHHTLLTSIRKFNTIHDATNVEQHELFGIDVGCQLPDVTPKRTNPQAVVEGVQSRFFQANATAEAIGHVCQAYLESPVGKGRSARWARTRSCSRNPYLALNSIESKPPPATSWATPQDDPKRNPPLTPDIVPFETKKGDSTQEGYAGA